MARSRPPLILMESRTSTFNVPPPTPTATSLLNELCTFTQEMQGPCERPKQQQRNISNIFRRIKLLSSFLEEIRDVRLSLPPTAVMGLRALHITIQKAKALSEECRGGSRIWLLMETKSVSGKFDDLTQELASALGSLPLDLLEISIDVKEQVELVRLQARRSKAYVDPLEEKLRTEVLAMIGKFEMRQVPGMNDMQSFFQKLEIISFKDCQREQHQLEEELANQSTCSNILSIAILKSLISFVQYVRCTLYGIAILDSTKDEDSGPVMAELVLNRSELTSAPANIPDEYKCPISLELMRDPVIIATGESYDRHSIQQWIDSGHSTCPKSGLELTHLILVPNYALKSLVSRWYDDHKISYASSRKDRSKLANTVVEDLLCTRAAMEATKLTATFLVEKLETESPELQKQVAYELRLLAKCGMDNRRLIGEAGAIPLLLPLLSSPDKRTQEDAVTTLLSLSIYDNNKKLIVDAGALDAIVQVLHNGKTQEARENAAETIFSLLAVDEYKTLIGCRQEIVAALVGLLRDGSLRGKKDSCTAILNLAVHHSNRPRLAAAGAIPLLLNLLDDEFGELTHEEVLGVLALLATVKEGLIAMSETNVISSLISFLRMGSAKGKENAAAVLVELCRSGSKKVLEHLLKMPSVVPSLYALLMMGTHRARRKASTLLKLLQNLETTSTSSAKAIR